MKKKKKNLKAFAFLIFVALLDQISKHLIQIFIPKSSSFTLIDGFLYITHVTNTGVSFGMLKGFNSIFIAVSLAALMFFYYIYSKNRRYWVQISLICAGIVGNTIDRITLGYVVDFIQFNFFPIFNIADSAITVGVIWLIFITVKNKEDLF